MSGMWRQTCYFKNLFVYTKDENLSLDKWCTNMFIDYMSWSRWKTMFYMYIHLYILRINEKNMRNRTSRFSKFGDDQYAVNLDSDITLFFSILLPTIKLLCELLKIIRRIYITTCKIVKRRIEKSKKNFSKVWNLIITKCFKK